MIRLWLSICLLLPWSAPVGAEPWVVTIPTRPGVTVRLVLDSPAAPPKGVLLMFPGGQGARKFEVEGETVNLGRNFLVHTLPLFVRHGWAVAVVDAPSDLPEGMSDTFRTSRSHAEDIRRSIDYLDRQGWRPLYLVGTSRGTLSAAYLAGALTDTRIKGLVLTASLGKMLQSLPLNRIGLPVLLVHHRDDACHLCPFAEVLKLKGQFPRSPRVDFMAVAGGLPPQSGPCQPWSPHGFFGMEAQAVQAISDWLEGKGAPSQVGP